MFQAIKNWLYPQEPLNYPGRFAIVTYTDTALQNNIKDNQNKIILYYFINDYGNRETKTYKYSEAQVRRLENNMIPVYDKTKTEQRFPVFIKTLPGDITYTKK